MTTRTFRGRSVRRTRGFTLVEMLVVISIIGMLAALLLPAVQGAREAGRRTVCTDKIHQLAIAMTRYEHQRNELPGYLNVQCDRSFNDNDGDGILDASNPPAVGTKVIQPCSWVFTLLPYIDKSDLYDSYGAKAIDSATPAVGVSRRGCRPDGVIEVLLCPSDSRATTVQTKFLQLPAGTVTSRAGGGNSYVVNTGMADVPRSSSIPTTLTVATGRYVAGSLSATVAASPQPRDMLANGVFFDRYPDTFSGATATEIQQQAMTMSFVSANDGTASTIMLTENIDSGNWNPSYCPLNNNTFEEQLGCVWWPPSASTAPPSLANTTFNRPDATIGYQVSGINQSTGFVDQFAAPGTGVLTSAPISMKPFMAAVLFARPSSNHPGVVVAAFCDARTRTLNDQIDYGVFTLLMTPRGRATQVVNNAAYFTGLPSGAENMPDYTSTPPTTAMQNYQQILLDEKSLQ